jgi:hypothetical protein
MLAEIAQTFWDPETGTLTMAKESARTAADLMNSSWFKDTFSDLDIKKSKGKKQPVPPLEALFNLDGYRLVTAIHEHHMKQPTTKSLPLAKGNNEFAGLVDTDSEDFASSPDDDRPHVHISQGVDDASPTSSDEEGENERAAGGR